jgi:hypothetical protein
MSATNETGNGRPAMGEKRMDVVEASRIEADHAKKMWAKAQTMIRSIIHYLGINPEVFGKMNHLLHGYSYSSGISRMSVYFSDMVAVDIIWMNFGAKVTSDIRWRQGSKQVEAGVETMIGALGKAKILTRRLRNLSDHFNVKYVGVIQ